MVVGGRAEMWEQVKEVSIAGLRAGVAIGTTTDCYSEVEHILAGTNLFLVYITVALVNTVHSGRKHICGLVCHPAQLRIR